MVTVERLYHMIKTTPMVGEVVMIREESLVLDYCCLTRVQSYPCLCWTIGMLASFVQFWTRKCVDTVLSRLNPKPCKLYIFLDSEEVCVKLYNALIETMVSSMCFSYRNFWSVMPSEIFHGGQIWHPYKGTTALPSKFSPFSEKRTTGWPLVVKLLVALTWSICKTR